MATSNDSSCGILAQETPWNLNGVSAGRLWMFPSLLALPAPALMVRQSRVDLRLQILPAEPLPRLTPDRRNRNVLAWRCNLGARAHFGTTAPWLGNQCGAIDERVRVPKGWPWRHWRARRDQLQAQMISCKGLVSRERQRGKPTQGAWEDPSCQARAHANTRVTVISITVIISSSQVE